VFVAELAVEAREFPNTSDAIRAAIDEVRFDETRFFVFDEHGRRLAATDTTVPVSARVAERPERAVDEGRLRALASPDSAASRPSGAVVLRSFPDSLGGYRVTISDLAIHGRRHTVAAAHSRHGIRDTLRLVAAAYAVAIPIILSLAAGFGYALARRALAPVTTMSQRAREISASTLHDRLPVANEYDELGELASVCTATPVRRGRIARVTDARGDTPRRRRRGTRPPYPVRGGVPGRHHRHAGCGGSVVADCR
jgi:Arc/MetJ-type ribon-helix-helix transcriptional regulator/HAMP domain-containing protein